MPQEQDAFGAGAQGATGAVGVVLTGDSHLSPYLPRLSPQRRAERRARLRANFAAVADYAIQRGARLFAQLGDLFDTPTPSNADRAFVAATLARLRAAGIACLAIGGNHDTPRMLTEQGGEPPQQTYAALGALSYFPAHDALVPRVYAFDGLRLATLGLSNNPVAAPGSDPLAGASIVDEAGLLASADVGLLLLHAGIEGFCQPGEGERVVTRASVEALPPLVRVVVGGHIHRFARGRIGARTVVVTGATERMEFGTASGASGFVWLELDREGAARVEHIRLPEQPRVELTLSTRQLWPVADRQRPAPPDALAGPSGADVAETVADTVEAPEPRGGLWPVGAPFPPAATGDRSAAPGPTRRILRELERVSAPETMVRLRLAGPLTREQYHQIAPRDILLFGQRHAFSLDLDTSGLRLLEPALPQFAATEGAGPISVARELEALVEARLSAPPPGATTEHAAAEHAADMRAAAALLLERLTAREDQEAGA